ncbi:MAG: hypothetical protein AAFW69_11225, partial [Pseudomonadota bacterium]
MTLRRRAVLAAPPAVAAGALAAPALAQGAVRLTVATAYGPDRPVEGAIAGRLADRIAAVSGGRITLEVTTGADAAEAFAASGRGEIAATLGGAEGWAGALPSLALFGPVPCGLSSREMEAWMHFGGGQEVLDIVAAEAGVKMLLLGDTVSGIAGWAREAPADAAALQGLAVRAAGLGGEVMAAAGATVVPLAEAAIAPALAAGDIAMSESLGLARDRALGLPEVTVGLTPALLTPAHPVMLALNASVWEGLDAGDRMLIETACLAENDAVAAEVLDAWSADFAALRAEGVRFVDLPEDVFSAVAAASDAV